MKFFKWLGIACLVVIVGVLAYGGYVYYKLTRTEVKDLGVRYTMADYTKAVKDKAGVHVPVPSDIYFGSNFKTVGTQAVDQIFSDAEISAIQNYSNEKKGPFKNVQIHFVGDNTIEASGLVLDPRVPKTGPVYVKGSIVQTGPKSFDISNIQELRVGDYVVPQPIVQQAKTEFIGYVNGILSGIDGLNIEKVEIQNGQVKFKGNVPKQVYSADTEEIDLTSEDLK